MAFVDSLTVHAFSIDNKHIRKHDRGNFAQFVFYESKIIEKNNEIVKNKMK